MDTTLGIGLRLLNLARAGELRIDCSDEILNETIGVLRDKFGWDGYRLSSTKETLRKLTRFIMPTQRLSVVVDSDDNRILECAVEAGSSCIITYDQHLRKLKSFQRIPIITPEEFLRRGIER